MNKNNKNNKSKKGCSETEQRTKRGFYDFEVVDLLNIWANDSIQKKFKDNITSHSLVYQKITSDFNEKHDKNQRPMPEIRAKLKNLQAQYRKQIPKSGAATPKWKFFAQIHAILGQSDCANNSLLEETITEQDSIEPEYSINFEQESEIDTVLISDVDASLIDEDQVYEEEEREQSDDLDDSLPLSTRLREMAASNRSLVLEKELNETERNRHSRFQKISAPPRRTKKEINIQAGNTESNKVLEEAIQYFKNSDQRSEEREEKMNSLFKTYLSTATNYLEQCMNNKDIASKDVTSNTQPKKSTFTLKKKSDIAIRFEMSQKNLEEISENNSISENTVIQEQNILDNFNADEWNHTDSLTVENSPPRSSKKNSVIIKSNIACNITPFYKRNNNCLKAIENAGNNSQQNEQNDSNDFEHFIGNLLDASEDEENAMKESEYEQENNKENDNNKETSHTEFESPKKKVFRPWE